MLTVFYLNIKARPNLFTKAHILSKEICMTQVFWDYLYNGFNPKGDANNVK